MKNMVYVVGMSVLGDGEVKPIAYDTFYDSKEEAMVDIEENESYMDSDCMEWHNEDGNMIGEAKYEDGRVVRRYLVGCWNVSSQDK